MKLIYDYWVGKFKDIDIKLKSSISQYTRHNKTVKIGITNNPERRKKQHQKKGRVPPNQKVLRVLRKRVQKKLLKR